MKDAVLTAESRILKYHESTVMLRLSVAALTADTAVL